ncbi:hypothetical protein B0H21DRAFT_826747 [Amylocystis lapponica]|nr:hypothetical protein B0H21DRAFT_826747 [Amylocystis lapponica]
MEGYCLSGVDGVISNYKRDFLDLKKKTAALILQQLNDVATNNIARMTYTNFDEHVTAKHGIMIKNWSLDKFCNPSAIGSHTELRKKEWEEWEETCFQAKLKATHSPGDDDDNADANADDASTPLTNLDNTKMADSGPTTPTASASGASTDDPLTGPEAPASSAPAPAPSADPPSTS